MHIKGLSQKYESRPFLIPIACRYILSVIMCLIFSGCMFKSLEKDLAILEQTSRLEGTISNPSPHQKPIIVLVYQLQEANKKLVVYSVQHRPGTFKFTRFPGRYLIAAFEDANEDLVY